MSLNMSMAFFHLFSGLPRGSFPCRHPACSRQEGQAECQHANAPPRQVPGREVAGFQLAPCLPFATWNPPPSPPGSCRKEGKAAFGSSMLFSAIEAGERSDFAIPGLRRRGGKVRDASQPPMTIDLYLRDSPGSRSPHRLVRLDF